MKNIHKYIKRHQKIYLNINIYKNVSKGPRFVATAVVGKLD